VGYTCLTCGQHPSPTLPAQVSPKREDLSSSARIFGFDFDSNFKIK
jgi:hypothetical protein